MHRSRLCAILIDCKTADIDEAAHFWGEALGRSIDPTHPGSRGNYLMLDTPPDEPMVQIQRVEHASRVHIDIETDLRRSSSAPRFSEERQSVGLGVTIGKRIVFVPIEA